MTADCVKLPERTDAVAPVKGSKNTRQRVGHDGLTRRERAFVHAYAQTLVETNGKGNATKAAIMIGCPEASAGQRGCGFMKLPRVKSAIEVLMDERIKKFDITADKVLQEIAALGFASMKDFLVLGEDGSAKVDWSKLSPEQAKAISEVTIDEYQERGPNDEDGKPTFETVKRIRFKLHDKKGSLELLGKHLKLFTDKTELSNPGGAPLAPPVIIIQGVAAEDGRPKQGK